MTLFLTSFFQSFLNNRHLFGASCLSRCLIYKVHTAASLSRRVLMITHRFRFVKNFFQVFSNFFEALSFAALSRLSRAGLAADSIRLPHSVRFVKSFFKFFQTFFELLTCEPFGPLRFRPVLPCRRALAYISKTAPVCQHLFSFFSSFFSTFFSTTISEVLCPF